MSTEPSLMSYDSVRPLIKSGDLLLCQGSSIFARMIQHATNSPWSHVGCLMRVDALERILVLESVESIGCRAIPVSRYISNYAGEGCGYPGRIFIARHRLFQAEISPAFQAFSQRAIDLLGYPYDTQSILRIAARVLAVEVGFRTNPITQNTAYICSEFAWEVYKAFGITLPYSTGGYIAPKDWAECSEVYMIAEVIVT